MVGVGARAGEEGHHYPIGEGSGWYVWWRHHHQLLENSDNYPVVSGTYTLMKIKEGSPSACLCLGHTRTRTGARPWAHDSRELLLILARTYD